jgi:hypothetical protein
MRKKKGFLPHTKEEEEDFFYYCGGGGCRHGHGNISL